MNTLRRHYYFQKLETIPVVFYLVICKLNIKAKNEFSIVSLRVQARERNIK